MAKGVRHCTRYGRGKGGRRVCKKYSRVTKKSGGAWSKYRKGVRRGIRSGKYKVKCSGFTEKLFGGKKRKQFRCRDMGSGRFTKSHFCPVSSRCKPR